MNSCTMTWAAVLVLRASGPPFTGLLLILSSILLLSLTALKALCSDGLRNRISWWMTFCGIALLFPRLYTSYLYPSSALAGSILALLSLLIRFGGKFQENRFHISQLMVVMVIFSAGIMPVAVFHHVFRSGSFEAYVTGHFDAGSPVAKEIIRSAIPPEATDRPRADDLLSAASEKEASGDFRGALKDLDRSLDADPYHAGVYVARGRFRLYRLELTEEEKLAAIKDFTNAIQLDSLLAAAYFYRGQAKSCMEPQPDFCDDILTAVRLDSTWYDHALEMGVKRCPDLSDRLPSK